MRRFFWSSAIGILAITGSAFLVVVAADMPETVTIDGCQAKQAAVEFPHQAHVGLAECKDCHHTQPDLKEGGAAETCGSCHNEPEKAETPQCSQMSTKKNPYHINCITCHKTDESGKAPTKCTQCHPKG